MIKAFTTYARAGPVDAPHFEDRAALNQRQRHNQRRSLLPVTLGSQNHLRKSDDKFNFMMQIVSRDSDKQLALRLLQGRQRAW